MGTTTARPRCLDLTRLASRVGRGPDTGVDRVERAYLRRLLAMSDPVCALVRGPRGFMLLDRDGMAALAARLDGQVPWGPPDLIGHLSRKAAPLRRRVFSDLRRLALARCRTGRLATMLARHVPQGCAYLNVGHANLRAEVFAAWAALPGATSAVLVHDMIPLDFPQYQRPGTAAAFEARMRQVSQGAHTVIYNSEVSQEDGARWFGRFGRVPDSIVAHLGVEVPTPDAADLPADLPTDRPYFVTLGTIEPRKDHALLLDVWDELAEDPEAPALFILGARGWENRAVFDRLDATALKDRLIFERSGLSDPAVAALLSRSAGLLCPSHAEGFGLPPAEAALLGVPIICRNLPVYRELLGDIPVYVDSDDVYSWKQSITLLTNQKRAGNKQDRMSDWTSAPTWDAHFELVLKIT